jgi:hypothetical protein
MKPGNYRLLKKRGGEVVGIAAVMSDDNVMVSMYESMRAPAMSTTVEKLQAKYKMEPEVKENSGEKISKSLQDIFNVHRK